MSSPTNSMILNSRPDSTSSTLSLAIEELDVREARLVYLVVTPRQRQPNAFRIARSSVKLVGAPGPYSTGCFSSQLLQEFSPIRVEQPLARLRGYSHGPGSAESRPAASPALTAIIIGLPCCLRCSRARHDTTPAPGVKSRHKLAHTYMGRRQRGLTTTQQHPPTANEGPAQISALWRSARRTRCTMYVPGAAAFRRREDARGACAHCSTSDVLRAMERGEGGAAWCSSSVYVRILLSLTGHPRTGEASYLRTSTSNTSDGVSARGPPRRRTSFAGCAVCSVGRRPLLVAVSSEKSWEGVFFSRSARGYMRL